MTTSALLAGVSALDPSLVRAFLAAGILVGLGLFALTPSFARLQRQRAIALLSSGGWAAVPLGILLGPFGAGLIDDAVLRDARPLTMIGLCWVGLVVGLQARHETLRAIPALLWRWTLLDAAAAIVVALVLAMALQPWWSDAGPWERLIGSLLPATSLAVAAIGWSPEARSLRLRLGPAATRVRILLQAGSGLSSLVAVALFGVVVALSSRSAQGSRVVELGYGVTGLAISTAASLGVAFGARAILTRVQRDQPETLVVLLGALALLSGIGDLLSVSPILVGAICGACVANLRGTAMRDLERQIHAAEPALAAFLFTIAGVLLHGALVVPAILLAAALLSARVLIKPAVARAVLSPEAPTLERELPLRALPLRQAPLAVVLTSSLVLSEGTIAQKTILAATVLAGAASTLLVFAFARRPRTSAALEARA